MNQKRIEKLRQTLAAKAENECQSNLTDTADGERTMVKARTIVADLMGVSEGYVSLAKQIKDASPELSERVRAGDLSLSQALAELSTTPADPLDTRIKSFRKEQNRLLKNAELAPVLLDRMEAVLAKFAKR